jgi:RNA polymerase sigma-70 factor (ECF subfamily)
LCNLFAVGVVYYHVRDERSNDEKLVGEILSGDRKAFETFVKAYERLVYHVVCRMISDSAAWEDLCQDVFLRIYQNLGSFRFECKLSSWVAKVAYNTCLNEMGRKKPVRYDDGAVDKGSIEELPAQDPSPESAFAFKDNAARIHEAVGKLPAVQRTVLTLFHLEGMSLQEVAEALDMPESTVKSHLFRSRQALRRMLLARYRKEELCLTI